MPAASSVSSGALAVPVVALADLPALARELAARVRATGFEPELIVYIETGARLFAHELGAVMVRPLAPVWVRRSGHGLKRRLAPLAARLPVGVRDWLRRVEERSGVHRLTRRAAQLPAGTVNPGRCVLLVDDASDTGRTIGIARDLLLAQGLARGEVRTAVLAATTPRARAAVDFYVLDRNCRMPWSADSEELAESARRAAAIAPLHAPRDL